MAENYDYSENYERALSALDALFQVYVRENNRGQIELLSVAVESVLDAQGWEYTFKQKQKDALNAKFGKNAVMKHDIVSEYPPELKLAVSSTYGTTKRVVFDDETMEVRVVDGVESERQDEYWGYEK